MTLAFNAVELHCGVPYGRYVALDAHFKQVFNYFEQTGQHAWGGEILLNLLLAEGVARFLKFFTDVRPIPRLGVGNAQVFSCKGAQVCQVLCGIGFGFGCQISQKLHHLFGRIGHFGHHRDLAEVGIPQQLCLFLAQSQDVLNQGAVIKSGTSALRLVGGTSDVCGVQSPPQVAVFGKLHHRQVARHFEGELVAVLAV